jgi:hypothetical protein
MSVVLLSGRKTLSLCFGRSHLATSMSANVRSGLGAPLGSHGGRMPHVLTDLGSSLSNCRLVPLVESTVKKEVIHWVVTGPGCGCGWRIEEWRQRASCMYKARQRWSGYPKKLPSICNPLKRQWNHPQIS